MAAAEALVLELEPFRLYGPSEIVRRVTGFRPEERDEEPSLVGQAVLADLSTLVERLSEGLALRPDDRPQGALPVDAAAARLGVSLRTLVRYRSMGLLVHWIDFGAPLEGEIHGAGRRVGCFIESLERFRERRLGDAPRGRPRRQPLAESRRVEFLQSAQQILGVGPTSMRRTAVIVAARHGAEVRDVRAVLAASALAFPRARRRSRDDVRFACRAWRRGVDPARIAERLGRDHAACWRAVNAGRRAALHEVTLPLASPLPTFGHPDAAEVLLAPESVRRGLSVDRIPTDALALLAANPPAALPPRAGELDACRRLVAMRFLLWRAAQSIPMLDGSATGAALDRVETDLRNAWLLRRTLVAHALPSALGRIEAAIGGGLEQLPASVLVRMLRRAAIVTAQSLDAADSADAADGRLRVARHAAHTLERDLAATAPPALERRASAMLRPGDALLPEIETLVTPWIVVVPRPFAPVQVAALPAMHRRLLERRFGWSGELAATLAELARQERVAPSILQHRLHLAEFGGDAGSKAEAPLDRDP